ncbi:MAG TPA: DUF624 domain-containing protein [Arachnia sp.]|nr:DUF624 domain-containing protein [Arachnia sp.]HMT87907.1 DUF624 domain-containing protein [Arachnia sp.]
MRRISHDTYALVFGVAYLGLMTNVMLTVACLPLLLLLVLTDPADTWLLLAGLSPLAAPAATAAFTVFRRYSDDGSVDVVRGFWRAWAATARRSLVLGAVAAALLTVLVLDIRVLSTTSYAALLVPPLAVATLLVLGLLPLALTALAEVPGTRLRDLAVISAVLGVRRWYLTLASLVILGSLGAFFILKPALALGLACGPLLYAVWANARYTLKPAIVDEGSTETDPAVAQ